MPEQTTFPQRLESLKLNVDALEEVRVHIPVRSEGASLGTTTHTIPNAPNKRGSLQIYAAITTNDGYITPEGARKGLEIFGETLRTEARQFPGQHQNIDLLEYIAKSGEKVRADVIRRNSEATLPQRVAKEIPRAVKHFGTPFILLDEAGIIQTLREINDAFSWNKGFQEFYAVKAFPNPSLLEILHKEGAGADCSSLPELVLANAAGIRGENIMFTSNNTPTEEFSRARSLSAIVNFDDITHIPFYEATVGELPEVACVRFNPGRERVGNSLIGNPEEAKYGFTRKQVFEAFKKMKQRGVKRFGLHTMVASNELNPEYHIETARMLFALAADVERETGINVEFVNNGGGWGAGYKPEQRQIDPKEIGQGVKEAYEQMVYARGLAPIKIFMENGRFVTGPHGWLATEAVHEKHTHREYVGVDATMADFMRPGIYGAYHHLVVLGKEHDSHDYVCDVVGSLCENSDKFAVNRPLPHPEIGDTMVLCGAGAHGRAMGFNYNGKLRCQELLLRLNGDIERIRRPETQKDYFATLDFPGSKFGNLAK